MTRHTYPHTRSEIADVEHTWNLINAERRAALDLRRVLISLHNSRLNNLGGAHSPQRKQSLSFSTIPYAHSRRITWINMINRVNNLSKSSSTISGKSINTAYEGNVQRRVSPAFPKKGEYETWAIRTMKVLFLESCCRWAKRALLCMISHRPKLSAINNPSYYLTSRFKANGKNNSAMQIRSFNIQMRSVLLWNWIDSSINTIVGMRNKFPSNRTVDSEKIVL